MVSYSVLLLGAACLFIMASGQPSPRLGGSFRPGGPGRGRTLFGSNMFRGRRPRLDSVCEASGAAEIVKPYQFIHSVFTLKDWQDIVDSIRLHNKPEWDRLQAYEEYYYPDAYYEYENYGDFECKDVCRHKRQRVQGARLNITDDWGGVFETACYIVGNPNIFYTECHGKRPDVHKKRILSSSMQCLPDLTQYREVIFYCPDAVPQCRTRTLQLPQACSLNEIKCKRPSPAQVFGRSRFG